MPDKNGQQVILGDRYRDAVTGIVGVATARAEYLNDNPSICVEFSVDDNGRPIDSRWISEGRLERLPDDQQGAPGNDEADKL